MNYSVKISTAAGDTIPLSLVAHAMARHVATAYGTLPVHNQTLIEQLSAHNDRLVSAAKNGALIVCGADGEITSADVLIGALDLTTEASPNLPIPNRPHYLLADSHEIDALYVKVKHLTDWATNNGDVFQIVRVTPSAVITSDLKNWKTGEVLEAGRYRTIVTDFEESESFQAETIEPVATAVPVTVVAPATALLDATLVVKPAAKKISAFDSALPYLRNAYKSGKFKTTDEFIRELRNQSGKSDSPFKTSTISDDAFYLMDGGRSISHSVISDRMKFIR